MKLAGDTRTPPEITSRNSVLHCGIVTVEDIPCEKQSSAFESTDSDRLCVVFRGRPSAKRNSLHQSGIPEVKRCKKTSSNHSGIRTLKQSTAVTRTWETGSHVHGRNQKARTIL